MIWKIFIFLSNKRQLMKLNEFIPSVYLDRKNAKGPSLNMGNILDLKEQRGIPKEDRVKEASRRTRKGEPEIEFKSAWKHMDETYTDKDKTLFYDASTGLPHFKNLNMRMLAGAWILWLRLGTPKEIKVDSLRFQTVTKFGRKIFDSSFITKLKSALLKAKEGEIKKSAEITREILEWDLIRNITILINFDLKI